MRLYREEKKKAGSSLSFKRYSEVALTVLILTVDNKRNCLEKKKNEISLIMPKKTKITINLQPKKFGQMAGGEEPVLWSQNYS